MITRAQALALPYGRVIYHRELKNADGTALRARVNGKAKTWKKRPLEFRLPLKHGLKDCFYLTLDNARDWFLTEPSGERPYQLPSPERWIDRVRLPICGDPGRAR